jgi:hypothetical protein
LQGWSVASLSVHLLGGPHVNYFEIDGVPTLCLRAIALMFSACSHIAVDTHIGRRNFFSISRSKIHYGPLQAQQARLSGRAAYLFHWVDTMLLSPKAGIAVPRPERTWRLAHFGIVLRRTERASYLDRHATGQASTPVESRQPNQKLEGIFLSLRSFRNPRFRVLQELCPYSFHGHVKRSVPVLEPTKSRLLRA